MPDTTSSACRRPAISRAGLRLKTATTNSEASAPGVSAAVSRETKLRLAGSLLALPRENSMADDNSGGGGNTMLALIVGGLLVVVVMFFVFGGFPGGRNDRGPTVNIETPDITVNKK